MEKIQKPHNYGPTPEEQEEVKRKQLAEREKHDREEREERERDEQEASIDRMKKQKEWALKLEQIKRDELQQLDTQSAPLRNYLMTHVMPTLTKALIGKDFLSFVARLSERKFSSEFVLSHRMLSSSARRSGRFCRELNKFKHCFHTRKCLFLSMLSGRIFVQK